MLLLTRIPSRISGPTDHGEPQQSPAPPGRHHGSRPIGSLHRLGAVRGPHRLGAIAGIDADIFRSEVAGPVTRAGRAGVQVHHDGNVVR